jgi:hypothetical protein
MVVAIVVIATILISAVLGRHSGQSLLFQRHIDGYLEHHAFKGLEESITAWLNGNGSGSVLDALDESGRAFDLQLPGGESITVSMTDAQGLALARFSGIGDSDLDDAASVIDRLRLGAGQRASQLIRTEGPLAVSIRSAPRDVLRAVCRSVLNAGEADALVRELMALQDSARDLGTLEPDALNNAFSSAGVDGEDRARLSRLLTHEPALFNVRVDLYRNDSGLPVVTYRATCLAGGSRVAQRGTGGITRSSAFLGWQRVYDGARTIDRSRTGAMETLP